jgi:hypothetical protein
MSPAIATADEARSTETDFASAILSHCSRAASATASRETADKERSAMHLPWLARKPGEAYPVTVVEIGVRKSRHWVALK